MEEKNSNRPFPKANIQRANTHEKTLDISSLQENAKQNRSKTSRPPGWLLPKPQGTTVCELVRGRWPQPWPVRCCWGRKTVQLPWKTVTQAPREIRTRPHDPAIPLWVFHPKELKAETRQIFAQHDWSSRDSVAERCREPVCPDRR